MSVFRLSKSKIISGLQCQKRLFLETHRPELAEVAAGTERLFSHGHQVNEIARSQQPHGKLIGFEDDLIAALTQTEALLHAEPEVVLFEPAFRHGGVLIRGDIFSRTGDKAHLVEVKSSTQIKSYHYNDAAIQYWVVTGAGYPLSSVSVAHIDSEFVYPGGGDYRGLLKQVNVTEEILPLIPQVPVWINIFQKVLAADIPSIETGRHCSDPFECSFWGFCSQGRPEYPIDILPHGGNVLEELFEEGYRNLLNVPFERLTSEKHQRVWRATHSGRYELDGCAGELIRGLPFPRFYLDFETIQFPVPIWIGTRPYEQLPFQWSCHIESESGELRHGEFLDLTGDAPMRSFAERLIATLGNAGPILVYGHFEGCILKELIERYPDLDVPLTKLLYRIKNLHLITAENYYHPAMKGSWSLKAVLPTVAADLAYDKLGDVQDGSAAQGAYLELIDPATPVERHEKLSNDLRDYCRMDTFALVKLAHFLADTQ